MASMNLRVRAASGGPTIRVQIPLFCSLQGLKDVLGPLISLPSISFSLSLNKKDEIQGPDAALLSSFGVTSGDLLYYIVNPGSAAGPSRQTVGVTGSSDRTSREVVRPRTATASASIGSDTNAHTAASPARAVSNPNTRRELCAAAATRRANLATDHVLASDSTFEVNSPPIAITEQVGSDSSDGAIEVENDGKAVEFASGHRLVHIPDLLQRVLSSEVGNVLEAPAYLVLAVHAVMLETGFVRVPSGGGRSALEGYELPAGWSAAGFVNLTYTLPELARSTDSSSGRSLGEEALLRCQVVGNAVVVYAAVTGGTVHRLSLSVPKFLRENVKTRMFAAGSSKENESCMEDVEPLVSIDGGRTPSSGLVSGKAHEAAVGQMEENVFRDIFELWKDVKDCLSLPLLTVMCEKAGLPPPPSLLRLPTELKIKVLDSLPSLALANISCACSELRFLAASEELWKQRYKEEFGASGETAPGGRGWKSAFVREFKQRRRREERREAERRFRAEIFPPGISLRPPSFSPHFGGLDYFQGLGGTSRGGFGGYATDVGGGFRSFAFRSGQSGNPAVFPSNWAGGRVDVGFGDYGDEDGVCFPGIDFDGNGVRAWPPVNSLGSRGTRSFGRLDAAAAGFYGGGPVLEYPQRLDGEDFGGLFQGLGTS